MGPAHRLGSVALWKSVEHISAESCKVRGLAASSSTSRATIRFQAVDSYSNIGSMLKLSSALKGDCTCERLHSANGSYTVPGVFSAIPMTYNYIEFHVSLSTGITDLAEGCFLCGLLFRLVRNIRNKSLLRIYSESGLPFAVPPLERSWLHQLSALERHEARDERWV